MKKRWLSCLLALTMVLSLVPVSVFHVAATTAAGTKVPSTSIEILGTSQKAAASKEGPENLFDADHQNTKWCVVSNTGWMVFKLDQPHVITSMTAYHARQSNDSYDKNKAKNTKAYALQIFKGDGVPAAGDYGDDTKWETVGEETANVDSVKTTAVTMTGFSQYYRLDVSNADDNAIRFYGLELTGYFDPVLIKFLPNGASDTMEDVSLLHGTVSYELPECTLTYAGKVFTGWKVLGGDDTIHAPGETISLAGDTTLVAQWHDPVDCAVTVKPGTHGTGEVSTRQIKELQSFTMPDAPTSDDPENWVFLGWKIGEDPVLKQPGDTIIIKAPVTVEAQWATYYSISFVPGDKGEGMQESIVVLHGKDYTLPEPTVTSTDPAFQFGGWSWDGQVFQPGQLITAAETRLYTAVWVKGIGINAVNFPDDNFRAYVKTLPGAEDNVFTTEEIAAIEYIDCDSKKIEDLTGIEHFTAMKDLQCSYNKLTTVDLSKNIALGTTVYNRSNCALDGNPLTSIKLPPKVCDLFLRKTKLTSLDFTQTTFKDLDLCDNPLLTSVKVNGEGLRRLDLDRSPVESLEIINGQASLDTLSFDNTRIKSLNLENYTNLRVLHAYETKMDSLNLKGCTSLNSLSFLRSSIPALDISETKITDFDPSRLSEPITAREGQSLNNPYLDPAKISNISGGTVTDGIVHYTDSNTIITYDYDIGKGPAGGENWKIHVKILDGIKIDGINFPDPIFRRAILQSEPGCLGADTDRNGYLSSAEISKITNIRMTDFYDGGTGAHPSNIKGIEYFTALTTLNISGLGLKQSDINLSPLTNLVTLEAGGSQITSLNVSGCSKLETLDCYNNQLTELDVSQLTNLKSLSCGRNKLTDVDVTHNAKLTSLDIGNSPLITSIDLSGCPDLVKLICFDTPGITDVDVSHNPKLEMLSMSNCGDIRPDLSHNPLVNDFHMVTKYTDVTELPKLSAEVIANMEKLDDGRLDDQGVLHFAGGRRTMSFSIKTGNSTVDSSDGKNRCVSYARELPDAELVGYQGQLDSNISVLFSVYISQGLSVDQSRGILRFTMPNRPVIELTNLPQYSKTYADYGMIYSFRCPVVAKEMEDNIKGELIVDGRTVLTFNYSFKQYLDSLMANKPDATTKELVKSLLNFGSASQELLKYKTDNLVNRDLSAEEKKLKATASTFDGFNFSGKTGILHYPVNAKRFALQLMDRIGIKLYFQYSNDPWKDGQLNNWFFKLNDRYLSAYEEYGYWCVKISNINIKHVDRYFNLVLEYGNPTQATETIQISPYNYCYQVMHSSTATQETKNVALALADYHNAVMDYVSAHP